MKFFLIKGFMTELLNTTGKRVERLRKDKHWTQVQLSELADVRQNYISGIEKDHASPSAEIMARIAKALGTSLDFLMMISDNPTVKEDSEPEFFSPEADEAARTIDSLPPTWRAEIITLIRDYETAYEETKKRAAILDELLRALERHGGAMSRQLVERFIQSQGRIVFKHIDLSAPPPRNETGKVKNGSQ